jgi:YegS/Rv2252/BmrU family lipid kinase
MRNALLLYNPSSGRRKRRREQDIARVQALLASAGVEVMASPTGSPERAAEQARQAAASGCEAVVACGGDGTIHDILQGLVGTTTALGVIPLGTANALAHDLKIPIDPLKAAQALVMAQPRRYAVGRIAFPRANGKAQSKYFTVAVGIGADAQLFYKLDQQLKTRWGMAAYYAKATHLWLTHPLETFEVEFQSEASQTYRATVSEALAVRITEFGGILGAFAPGASLARNDMRLVLFRTRSRLRYLEYLVRAALRQAAAVPGIELEDATRVTATLSGTNRERRVYVEADGELVGTLPAELSVVPDALTLLVPHS